MYNEVVKTANSVRGVAVALIIPGVRFMNTPKRMSHPVLP